MTGAAALLQPLLDLARDPATREAARTYFTSPTVTVNLIPAILVLGALAAALPLLCIPFLPQLADLLGLGGSSGGGYGAPAGKITALLYTAALSSTCVQAVTEPRLLATPASTPAVTMMTSPPAWRTSRPSWTSWWPPARRSAASSTTAPPARARPRSSGLMMTSDTRQSTD